MNLTWYDWHQGELTTHRLYDILALRNAVFIIEQACLYQDVDGQDLRDGNRHVAGYWDDTLVAYARILATGDRLVIGRVIIAPPARGLRLGHQLMERALAVCETHWPGQGISLSAQAHLQDFYRQFGFKAVTDIYDEDGIMHIGMSNRP
ncbi:GNAT family N-acetyltransferase [Acerihabitans sp. TG2]|uniref:GNAT family N-acetyltransferase n=1 Tax=Acerihabitans sp. TG2 TaxID=3096008 RepID=UPI002B22F6EF|nr:GNAT family N-acetyltransferase [Acerihabitans sp. TG2]MEA9392376.1 GNAT family N-acetyltransferase [Acerihabitans sp. TG2]